MIRHARIESNLMLPLFERLPNFAREIFDSPSRMPAKLTTNFVSIMLITATTWLTPVAAADSSGNGTVQRYDLFRLASQHLFTYDQISMPANDEPMGLLGLLYTVDLPLALYSGAGIFGGLTGNQGGLFTLGLEAGINLHIHRHWRFRAGYYFGGGGGKVGTGDGLMTRYYYGLSFVPGKVGGGLHYSDIAFPDSEIHGRQIGLSLEIPIGVTLANPDYMNVEVPRLSLVNTNGGPPPGFQQFTLALIQQNYFQRQGTLDISGLPQDGIMRLLGFEISRSFNDHCSLRLKLAGAYSGIHHGYMDIIGGLGYQSDYLFHLVALTARLNLGLGGGGHVETGGGFLAGLDGGVKIRLGPLLRLQFAGGFISAPDGNLMAASFTSQLGYRIDLGLGTQKATTVSAPQMYKFSGWSVRLSDQMYDKPQRKITMEPDDVRLVGVKIDRLINNYLYLTGQGLFAYSGEHVGGLAVGLVGAGLQHRPLLNELINLFGELLVGAAGGGHLTLGGGAITQIMTGVDIHLNSSVALRLSTGKIIALKDELNSKVVDIGIVFKFSLLTRKITSP